MKLNKLETNNSILELKSASTKNLKSNDYGIKFSDRLSRFSENSNKSQNLSKNNAFDRSILKSSKTDRGFNRKLDNHKSIQDENKVNTDSSKKESISENNNVTAKDDDSNTNRSLKDSVDNKELTNQTTDIENEEIDLSKITEESSATIMTLLVNKTVESESNDEILEVNSQVQSNLEIVDESRVLINEENNIESNVIIGNLISGKNENIGKITKEIPDTLNAADKSSIVNVANVEINSNISSVIKENSKNNIEKTDMNIGETVETSLTKTEQFAAQQKNFSGESLSRDHNNRSGNESSETEVRNSTIIVDNLDNPHNKIETRSFEEVISNKFEANNTVEEMLKDINYELNSSKRQMKIQLKPRELGDMNLDIQVVKGELIAKIIVDNDKVKSMIEQNLINLKETLRKQNVEIKTIEVQVGSNQENYLMHGQNMENRQSQNRNFSKNRFKNNYNSGYSEQATDEGDLDYNYINSEGLDISI